VDHGIVKAPGNSTESQPPSSCPVDQSAAFDHAQLATVGDTAPNTQTALARTATTTRNKVRLPSTDASSDIASSSPHEVLKATAAPTLARPAS